MSGLTSIGLPINSLPRVPRSPSLTVTSNAVAGVANVNRVGARNGVTTLTVTGPCQVGYLAAYATAGVGTGLRLTVTVDGKVAYNEAMSGAPPAADSGVIAVDSAITGPIYVSRSLVATVTGLGGTSVSLSYGLVQLEG